MKTIVVCSFLLLVFAGMKAQEIAEPLSPPQLLLPEDGEQVEVPRPLFTWLPITPVNLSGNISYDWILVDIQAFQTSSDAIQQNIPVFTQRNIRYTSFQYPLSAPELDSSKQYAWRVTAVNGISPVANSEIWTFRLKEPDSIANLLVKEDAYIKVKKEQDGALGIISGIIRYEYLNETNDSLVSLTVLDITGPSQKQIPVDPSYQKIHFGKNLLELDLSKNNLLLDKHIYILQLVNSKNDRWYLKFEYRKP